MSDLELMVLEDIIEWCYNNGTNYYLDPTDAEERFWKEKLCSPQSK